MHHKDISPKILPKNSKQMQVFLENQPQYNYSSDQLIREFNAGKLHRKLQIIEFFSNAAFLNLMVEKNLNKFINFIADRIVTIESNSWINKRQMLNTLIHEILPILKESDVFGIVSKTKLLYFLSEEQIISLFQFINSKNNQRSYYHICSFEKILQNEKGNNYLSFTGKTLYLKKLCNSYMEDALYNYIVVYFIKLSPKEWDIVVSQAKAGTFCTIPQYHRFFASQKTSYEINQFINFITELGNQENVDKNVIKNAIQYAGYITIAHCNFQLLYKIFKAKNAYIIKIIFDTIFSSSDFNIKARARKVILSQFDHVSYGEIFFLLVDRLYPQDFQEYMNSKMLPNNILNQDTQLKILYILLHEKKYYQIDQLNIMQPPSNNLSFVEHKLYIIASIQGISKFLPAIIDHLRLIINPEQLYRVMVKLYNLHLRTVNNSVHIYSSMIILNSYLWYYSLYVDDAKKILINCFNQYKLNVMRALFCYIIDYNTDYNGSNIPIEDLFYDLLQYCEDDLKAAIFDFTFKKFWQEEQYEKCSIFFQQPFIYYNTHLLSKFIYYISTFSSINKYKQLLDYISHQCIDFSMNALQFFQYNTILDLKSDAMILTLAYFPDTIMLQQWCDGFNSYNHRGYHQKGLHFEKLALNPQLAIFIHSFLIATRYKFNDILTIKSYYCAAEIPEYEDNISIQIAQYLKNNQQKIIDEASKALNIFTDHFPKDLKDWTTVIWGINSYGLNEAAQQNSVTC